MGNGNTIPPDQPMGKLARWEVAALTATCALFVVLSIVGVTWGLPSKNIDRYLFGGDAAWSGEKIYRLAGADGKFSRSRGADVDVDPLKPDDDPVNLTATDADIAKIYLRYRLYTYQPDEMITMMSLAGMRPGQLDLDPRLYQYGGLFIYPVGALIKACGLLGLIDVRSDVVFYLDRPDEFAKFYIVARLYAAAWGVLGVCIVFGIARRLGGSRAGWLAALLFTILPVVVCMAHEGKPHLPGAVLMLAAVYFAMRYVEAATHGDTAHAPGDGIRRQWWLMCICCGAALGMVLSSLPIFVLIPLAAWLSMRKARTSASGSVEPRNSSASSGAVASRGGVALTRGSWRDITKRTTHGLLVAGAVYLVTNPYVLINLITNREVLLSNFGNSLAMYEIARLGEGLWRVVELTAEGATWPILVCGALAFVLAVARKQRGVVVLAVPATVFFLQFVLIGAGKPAEYGRFGVFPDAALAIATACLLSRRWTKLRAVVQWMPAIVVLIWCAGYGGAYLTGFMRDTGDRGSRIRLVKSALRQARQPNGEYYAHIGLLREPAPYCCPPLDFNRREVVLFRDMNQFIARGLRIRKSPVRNGVAAIRAPSNHDYLIEPLDHTVWLVHRNYPEMGSFATQFTESRHLPRRGWTWPPDTLISWANKPFLAASRGALKTRPAISGEQ